MPWAPTYVSPGELASWLGVEEDPELALAAEAASRAIDQWTGRQFGIVDAPETRWYAAEFHDGIWYVSIYDCMTDDGLTIETDDGTAITDYVLTPRNAVVTGKPWTGLEIRQSVSLRNGVNVTALFGWSEIPDAIAYATKVQASRFYDRRNNVGGMLTKKQVDDVEYGWSASGATQDLDADVLASISAYRRLWGAA